MIERFRVAPGSVTALSVTGGDRFEVIDRYGRQAVELTESSARVPFARRVRPTAQDKVRRERRPHRIQNRRRGGHGLREVDSAERSDRHPDHSAAIDHQRESESRDRR